MEFILQCVFTVCTVWITFMLILEVISNSKKIPLQVRRLTLIAGILGTIALYTLFAIELHK